LVTYAVVMMVPPSSIVIQHGAANCLGEVANWYYANHNICDLV